MTRHPSGAVTYAACASARAARARAAALARPASDWVQLGYLLAAVGLGLAVPEISIGFTVSTGRVIEALVAVGIGIMTLIGVVYSLLFLVVQFGTTTFRSRSSWRSSASSVTSKP